MTNNNDNKWQSYPQHGGSNNPPTANEVRVLRRCSEKFETSNAAPVLEAAFNIMSLVHDITDMKEPVDKEQHVS
ncbi:hypothetical protein N7535_001947 [Penicillium sp. DV-2018c]|nr:hypothetical protein N7535_001947 [Penicillium sp. DV-2018c]